MSHLENSWEEQLLEQQDHLEKEMEEAKKMISGLQVRNFLFSQISPTYSFFFSYQIYLADRLSCS